VDYAHDCHRGTGPGIGEGFEEFQDGFVAPGWVTTFIRLPPCIVKTHQYTDIMWKT